MEENKPNPAELRKQIEETLESSDKVIKETSESVGNPPAPDYTLAQRIIVENEEKERLRSIELFKKLEAIREKDNCLRVRTLDRIADFMLSIAKKIERWSEKVRNYNAHTTTVCDIKLKPREHKTYVLTGKYGR